MNENRITQIGYYRNVVNQLIQIQLYKEHNHDYEHKIFELKQSFLNLSRSFDYEETLEYLYLESYNEDIFYVISLLSKLIFGYNVSSVDKNENLTKIKDFIEHL